MTVLNFSLLNDPLKVRGIANGLVGWGRVRFKAVRTERHVTTTHDRVEEVEEALAVLDRINAGYLMLQPSAHVRKI